MVHFDMTTPLVKQPPPPAQEIPAEIIATSIVKIAEGMEAMRKTRLTRRCIVTLIHEQSKIARRDIEIVLNNLDQLETTWLKPLPQKK
jgi:hypothetical protein